MLLFQNCVSQIESFKPDNKANKNEQNNGPRCICLVISSGIKAFGRHIACHATIVCIIMESTIESQGIS